MHPAHLGVYLLARLGCTAAAAKRRFLLREALPPQQWLRLPKDISAQEALQIVTLLADTYGLAPTQLRMDDTLAELAQTDWFGDGGMELDWLLRETGMADVASETRIDELIALLTPLPAPLAAKIQRMYG